MSTTQTKKYVKLIMVTADNRNKYYEMMWDGQSSNFNVKYGRIESTSVETSYPISSWDKKYKEKVNKGYVDVTQTVAVKMDNITPSQYAKIAEFKVEDFVTKMKKYTDNLVSSTYTVQAKDVTQAQVDEAQSYINELVKYSKETKINTDKINSKLLQLYTIIPRKMYNVKSHLMPNVSLKSILEDEQDNLDAMASQITLITPKKKSKVSKANKTLLDTMGITMKEIKPPKELDYLITQIKGQKIEAVFQVDKEEETKVFDKWLSKQKDKSTKILIHGTKCTSVIPILEQGLKIRPVGNFQFSGKAYGDGNYFSEVVQKSLGYTGYNKDKILFVYEVHTGNPFVYSGWYRGNSFTLNYKELSKRGFDSTYVSAGNGLLNSEIIAYNEEQCKVKYLIWLT